MMTVRTTRRALVTAASMMAAALVVTACGSPQDSVTGGGDTAPVKVGLVYSRSGALASYGKQYLEGFRAGLAYATNGINKVGQRPVEVTEVDDAGDPAKAVIGAAGATVSSVLAPAAATDFAPFASQLAAAKPDLLFVAWAGTTAPARWQTLDQQGVLAATTVTGLDIRVSWPTFGAAGTKISFLSHFFDGAADGGAAQEPDRRRERAAGRTDEGLTRCSPPAASPGGSARSPSSTGSSSTWRRANSSALPISGRHCEREEPGLRGRTGMLSFGHALLAALLGAVALRTAGIAFAMVTLAFAQVGAILVARDFGGLTGGEEGLPLDVSGLPAMLVGVANTVNLYWLALAYLALVVLVVHRVVDSPTGRVFAGIRDDERRIGVLGLAPYRFKLVAFILSGAPAGGGGIVYCLLVGGASPHVTSSELTLSLLVMVVLGGPGTRWGPVLGGLVSRTSTTG